MRVRFVEDFYTFGRGGAVSAYLDGICIAQYVMFASRCSVRWLHVEKMGRGAMEWFDTEVDGRRAIEAWASGLDIVPWDEEF